ncbi:MAG: bifunctional phosphoribosyl-AMP cyclohydrolase/phosphoribosyl-ATP diphosphatase HisIE [Thermoflexales bacterium]
MIDLRFDSNGLIPAVAQDATTGRVLMVAWMNAEAVRLTRETGEAWFWSRSRQALWRKGETSGNVLRVREIRADCDADTLLMRVDPAGPACHTGRESCFWQGLDGETLETPPDAGFLDTLANVIASRRGTDPERSYTARLFASGRHKIAQKVGEEGLEVAMAGVAQDDERVLDESADLLYHLLVLLDERGLPFKELLGRLAARHTER